MEYRLDIQVTFPDGEQAKAWKAIPLGTKTISISRDALLVLCRTFSHAIAEDFMLRSYADEYTKTLPIPVREVARDFPLSVIIYMVANTDSVKEAAKECGLTEVELRDALRKLGYLLKRDGKETE